MLVEKRVAGIIRWLERLKQSYSSGAIESALMDAECARADLENLRQDVWAQVRPSAKNNNSVFECIMNFARTFSLALIIVMMSVMPLSREVPVFVREVPVSENDYKKFEPVNPKPIIVIREYEPPKSIVRADKPETVPSRKQPVQTGQKRTASKRTQTVKTQTPPEKIAKTAENAQVLPYDKVYSLIQTGQRALKNSSSVIKIQ